MPKQQAKRPPFGQKGRDAARNRPRDGSTLAVALPPLAWRLSLAALPLILVIALGAGSDVWAALLSQGPAWRAYGLSLGLALLAAVVTSALVFPYAHGLAFKVAPGLRRLSVLALILPFFTSYLMRAYSSQFLPDGEGLVCGLFGALVSYLTLALPLVAILQLFVLARIDRSLIEAAYNLGCGPKDMLVQVVQPMARGWVIIAALACFILSFSDFIGPLYPAGSGPPGPLAVFLAVAMLASLLAVAVSASSVARRKKP